MRKVLTAGLLAILTTTFSMAQTNEREILSDELCDKLCATTHEKSKEMGIDISFAIADRHGLPRAYRRYGDALVLSITLVAGGYPLFADGKIVGAIGVGGGTEAQDCEIAEHMVKVFEELIEK